MEAFFKGKKWKPFSFQRKTWQAYSDGKSGLLHAPTGTGKTFAVWAPPLIEWINEQKNCTYSKRPPKLRILWITPLRALVEDTTQSLQEMVEGWKSPGLFSQGPGIPRARSRQANANAFQAV